MDYPFEMTVPIAWGDMDAFGHVNNVQYLRYFETARVAFFASLPSMKGFKDTVKPVLASLSCQYKKPVVYPDELRMHVGIKSMGNTSFVMACQMHSPKVGLAAEAECVIVMFDFSKGKPTTIPEDLKAFIHSLQLEKP